jgi:N-succinyl-L-ornithine transcarbamylase
MRRFTCFEDVKEVRGLLDKALALKNAPESSKIGLGKTLVLLFFNPSLRTRLSTEKAALQLGMRVMSMNADQGWQLEFEDNAVMNLDKAEHVKEAAAVISQYADIIGIRTFPTLKDKDKDYSDQVIEKFIQYASVPVISLESAILHPLQSLADWMTIEEHKKKEKPVVVLSWAPHPRALPQAVSNSFLNWMKNSPYELRLTHPEGYELDPRFTSGVPTFYRQEEALEGADFVYVKNWSAYTSYGQILRQDLDWMMDMKKLKHAFFMHCLPVRRNVVVADEVLDSTQSLVLEQANNRTFAAQAVLHTILENL